MPDPAIFAKDRIAEYAAFIDERDLSGLHDLLFRTEDANDQPRIFRSRLSQRISHCVYRIAAARRGVAKGRQCRAGTRGRVR